MLRGRCWGELVEELRLTGRERGVEELFADGGWICILKEISQISTQIS